MAWPSDIECSLFMHLEFCLRAELQFLLYACRIAACEPLQVPRYFWRREEDLESPTTPSLRCDMLSALFRLSAALAGTLMLIAVLPTDALTQSASKTNVRPIVTLDVAGVSPAPPFDQTFVLRIPVKGNKCAHSVLYAEATRNVGSGAHFATSDVDSSVAMQFLTTFCDEASFFLVKPLAPNKRYLFRVLIDTKSVVESVLGRTTSWMRPASDTTDFLVDLSADLTTHFDADFGVIWTPRPGPQLVAFGSNVHLYFVPINKSESVNNRNDTWRDQIFKRVSVLVGLAAVQIASGALVENRTKAGNPLVGIGFKPRFAGSARRFDFFRLNAGVLFFSQKDPNPLVGEMRKKVAPFLSLTGDVEIQKLLSNLGGLIGAK